MDGCQGAIGWQSTLNLSKSFRDDDSREAYIVSILGVQETLFFQFGYCHGNRSPKTLAVFCQRTYIPGTWWLCLSWAWHLFGYTYSINGQKMKVINAGEWKGKMQQILGLLVSWGNPTLSGTIEIISQIIPVQSLNTPALGDMMFLKFNMKTWLWLQDTRFIWTKFLARSWNRILWSWEVSSLSL